MKKVFSLLLVFMMILPFACALGEEETGAQMPAVGDRFYFGRWEQDNVEENGYEPLEWVVLDCEEDRLFLQTVLCIEVARFYDQRVRMYWGISPLRTWMNGEWLEQLFTAEEQSCILTTTVKNANPHGIKGAGADTEDKLYLLSRDECLAYYPTLESRVAWPTQRCIDQGCTLSKTTGSTRWWLRTPGAREMDVQGVRIDGRITAYGMQDVDWPTNCLRPVMWVQWSDEMAQLITLSGEGAGE